MFGGLFGYLIGMYLYSHVGQRVVEFYHAEEAFIEIHSWFEAYGIWIILGASFTPFPFKFITIASGVFHLNLLLFILVAIIGRGLRFYIVATLLKVFGNIIKKYIDRYFNLLSILFFILLIGSFVLIKY